jgi:hypothetical protein
MEALKPGPIPSDSRLLPWDLACAIFIPPLQKFSNFFHVMLKNHPTPIRLDQKPIESLEATSPEPRYHDLDHLHPVLSLEHQSPVKVYPWLVPQQQYRS